MNEANKVKKNNDSNKKKFDMGYSAYKKLKSELLRDGSANDNKCEQKQASVK
jgi:hypothetical protein